MCPKIAALCLVLACLFASAISDAAQEPKKRTGTVIGTMKSQKDSKDGKNTLIDVLAPGEEKARTYHVLYDPKIKGPIPSVLTAVRAAKTGDVVEIDWVDTNHGPAIQSFRLFKKTSEKK